MNDAEFVLSTLKSMGKLKAKYLQDNAKEIDSEVLYESKDFLPLFDDAVKEKNMLEREVGFTCVSKAGNVVFLLQKYDSNVYTQQPEELQAQWGFKWSKDPKYASEFIAVSTSPYMKNDCCIENGKVYSSTIDNNVYSPSSYPQGWEEVLFD